MPCQPRLMPTTQRSITRRYASATVVKATTSRVAPRSLGMPEQAAVPPRPTAFTAAATSGLPGSQPRPSASNVIPSVPSPRDPHASFPSNPSQQAFPASPSHDVSTSAGPALAAHPTARGPAGTAATGVDAPLRSGDAGRHVPSTSATPHWPSAGTQSPPLFDCLHAPGSVGLLPTGGHLGRKSLTSERNELHHETRIPNHVDVQ